MTTIGATTGDLLSRLQSGALTSVELTTAYLDQISKLDPQVGAFLTVDRESTLERAAEIDRRRASKQPLGKLAGLPIAIKDVICTQGQRTTCASKILSNFIPPYDAHVIQRLRQADAILLGKTNMDEFAMGSTTESSAFQITRNPWDLARTPGGSSGGSAAAVAAGMCSLSLGTDTGGSIRQPAGFCSVVGLKPTYGRVSRYGVVAYASSLDQVGPFANDVAGAALLAEVISGHDVRDSTSVNSPVPEYSKSLDQPLAGLRIGIAREHFVEGLNPEVERCIRDAVEVYRSLGASVKEVSLPHSKYGVAVYYLIAPSEASSNLARYDGVHYGHRTTSFNDMVDMYSSSRGEGFGPEVKRRIMLGNYALSAGYFDKYYSKALKVRRLIRQDFDKAFEEIDVLASPVSPNPPFRTGEHSANPLAMYLEDIYTISANLAGLPGISLPAGFTQSGLPIGLQLMAPPFEEERLLRAARMFESNTNWHSRRPALLS